MSLPNPENAPSACRPLGAPLIRMGAVTSTMDIARRLETLGAAEGTTIVAASQSSGRGRSNRTWASPPGTGLYCSILLRPQISPDRFRPFSIAAGLALCEALDPDRSLGLQLKWPNDILYRNRKLAGILITSSLTGPIVGSATLGIGINLQPDSSRPETAVSLAEIDTSPRLPFPPDSIGPILRSLATRYSDICASQSAAISDWTGRLAYRDQPVVLQDGNTTHTGTLQGLDAFGAVILSTFAGPRIITTGELTRGPSPI